MKAPRLKMSAYGVKLVIDDINLRKVSLPRIIPANTLMVYASTVRIEIKYTGSELVIGEVISFEGDEVRDKGLYTFTKDGEVLTNRRKCRRYNTNLVQTSISLIPILI